MTKFIPKIGQKYYTLEVDITEAFVITWFREESERDEYFKTNCFKTRKEAQAVLKQIKLILKND